MLLHIVQQPASRFTPTQGDPCNRKDCRGLFELRGEDLNLRPSGYEPDELPDCSTPLQWDARSPFQGFDLLSDGSW